MDDPLIGLTIYDTSSAAVDIKDSPSASGEPGKRVEKLRQDSEDCFPCLPSMPDSHEKVRSAATVGSNCRDDLEGPLKSGKTSDAEKDGAEQGSTSSNYWLMRLFQSSLFDMPIAIGYLFNSKDQNVQSYLGNKLFIFEDKDVDFYLPQLINMYIHIDDLSGILHNYFLHRCRNSVLFSLKTAWMLRAYVRDSWLPSQEQQRGAKLLFLVMNEQIRPQPLAESVKLSPVCHVLASHHRSHSSGQCGLHKSFSSSQLSVLDRRKSGSCVSLPGEWHSGRAFDTGCCCVIEESAELSSSPIQCKCPAPRLAAQHSFVKYLGRICIKLLKHSTKELRTAQLHAELTQLNFNLPARVCVPFFDSTHQVLRVPSSESVVLNSKSKAPYMIVIEVAECRDTFLSKLPSKQLDTNTTSEMLTSQSSQMIPAPSYEPTEYSAFHKSVSSIAGLNVKPQFCVADVRKRLKESLHSPRKCLNRDPEDPSASAMREPWDAKVQRIRSSSPYGNLKNWKLLSVIVKWGDDLRQEVLCSQLLMQFKDVWRLEQIPLWVKPYNLMVVGSEGGLIEPVTNAISLHQIKKQKQGRSLLHYFLDEFGESNSEKFLACQKNFVHSCAAYCLICYFTQVKDRHNGNILLDSDGHLIHIDFGFILACSPGNNLGFENSPFKLTTEFVEVMDGLQSDMFNYFKLLMLKGFLAARKHMEKFVQIVEIMQTGSQLPCFGHGPSTLQQLKQRFHMNLTEGQIEVLLNSMIETSVKSLTTKLYDQFQYITNGIL